MLESAVKKRLYRWLDDLGFVSKSKLMSGSVGRGTYYPHPASRMGVAGAPDVYVFGSGKVILVECKSDTGKMTPLQAVSARVMLEVCNIPTLEFRPSTTKEELGGLLDEIFDKR